MRGWLNELSTDMLPEDGCLRVYDVGEHSVTAVYPIRHRVLAEMISDGRAPPRVK